MIRRLSIVWCFLIRFERGEFDARVFAGGWSGVSERLLGHDACGWTGRAGAWGARTGKARSVCGLARLSERVLARGARAGEAVGTLAENERHRVDAS
jgi:hypothetical protein